MKKGGKSHTGRRCPYAKNCKILENKELKRKNTKLTYRQEMPV